MEILAPAGSIEMLKRAIANGADAVYLGVEAFSARAKATDFTTENLASHVGYCHKFGVKVYLTLNTVVTDAELSSALRIAKTAYLSGVDAVLIQDLGLASVLKKNLPHLALHASTQMGIHNVEGAKIAAKAGCCRVVLARETPLKDMIAIKKETGLEIEVFVHGALCVCFSGNCYYSSLVSGNSGNRGKCLQLCRKNYLARLNGKQLGSKAWLSPKDLCLVKRLKELEAAGVDSVKIEGRMKRPEYAGLVTDAYRRADTQAVYDLQKIFNRGGFCEGYLDGKTDFVGMSAAGHIGVWVGNVMEITPHSCTIVSKSALDPEDGFKVLRDGKEVCGATHPKDLGNNRYRLSVLGAVKIGDEVRLTTDAGQIAKQNKVYKKIPLRIRLKILQGEVPTVSAESPYGHITFSGKHVAEPAVARPLTESEAKASFDKLTETDYYLTEFSLETNGVFLPKSMLNALRRDAIEALDQSFIHKFDWTKMQNDPLIAMGDSNVASNRLYLICHSAEELHRVESLKEQAVIVYAPNRFDGLEADNGTRFLQLPSIATGKDLALLKKQSSVIGTYAGIVAENLYALQLATEYGWKVIAGYKLNVCNHAWTTPFYDVFYSAEATFGAKEEVVFGLGMFPLMTVAHCPYQTVSGQKCSQCAFDGTLTYEDECGMTLKAYRTKVTQCTFELCTPVELSPEYRDRRMVVDMRELTVTQLKDYLGGRCVMKDAKYFPKTLK